jgi:hypothetical protein
VGKTKKVKRAKLPPTVHVSMRVPRALARDFRLISKAKKRSVTETILDAMEFYRSDYRALPGSVLAPLIPPPVAPARPDDPYIIRDMP